MADVGMLMSSKLTGVGTELRRCLFIITFIFMIYKLREDYKCKQLF